jgi:hypothetical protein
LDKTSDERLAIKDGFSNITSGALENGNGVDGRRIEGGTDGHLLLPNENSSDRTYNI